MTEPVRVPTTKPLDCVIVGCGAIVELQYVPAINAVEGLNVVALADPNAARVQAIRNHFPSAQPVARVEDAKADIAIVASPAAYHADQAIAAMEAGMHVLCEKPMAASAAEAARMVEASRATGKLLAVGLFRRFFPAVQTIRALITHGTLGPVKRYQIAEGGEFDWPAVSATFFQKAHARGGVLLDLGAHTLDLVLHWFGEPTTVQYEDDAAGGLDASCFVQLTHSGGVSGEIRLSREWKTSNRFFIEFERGWLGFSPGGASRLEIGLCGCDYVGSMELASPSRSWGLPAPGLPGNTYNQCFTEQLKQFVQAVQQGKAPLVSGEDGLANLQLIERCYSLKQSGSSK